MSAPQTFATAATAEVAPARRRPRGMSDEHLADRARLIARIRAVDRKLVRLDLSHTESALALLRTSRLREILAASEALLADRVSPELERRITATEARARVPYQSSRAHLLRTYGTECASKLTESQAIEYLARLEGVLERDRAGVDRVRVATRERGGAVFEVGDLVLSESGLVYRVTGARVLGGPVPQIGYELRTPPRVEVPEAWVDLARAFYRDPKGEGPKGLAGAVRHAGTCWVAVADYRTASGGRG